MVATTFYEAWEFNRDLSTLVGLESTTLDTLNAQMLKVNDPEVDLTATSHREIEFLAGTWTQGPDFIAIRIAELFHGARLEHNNDYVLAAVGHLGGRWDRAGIRAFMLTHDQDLRENVFWRFFEVEGGGEISLANVDKFSGEDCSWKDTVLSLAADGVLDRQRILRSCLEALNRDFSSYRAGWFSRLYDALKPSAAETRDHQPELHRLLASPNTATVSLAVRRLSGLHKDGILDATPFVQHCPPALTSTKTTAMAVLRVLRSLATPDAQAVNGAGACLPELFAAAALGLAHPHEDVQRAAVALLDEHRQTGTIESGRATLSPAVARELTKQDGHAAVVTNCQEDGATDVSDQASSAVAALPVPVWSEDEVLERFAALLENPDDAIEFELALAWLASHDTTQLHPVTRRASRLDNPGYPNENALVDLLLAAHDRTRVFRPPLMEGQNVESAWDASGRLPEDFSVVPVFHKRVREVAAIVQLRDERRTLLATPTESCGWIDPGVLVDRFLAEDVAGRRALHFDLIVALLRVGPEGRPDALATLQSADTIPANTEARNALAYALGGPAREIGNAAWWVAAARARSPHGVDEHLRSAGLLLRGQAEPATLAATWTKHRRPYEQRSNTYYHTWWMPKLAAGPTGWPLADFPTVVPSRTSMYIGGSLLEFQQVALTLPACTLPLAAAAIPVLRDALDATGPQAADGILAALENHPGRWTEATAELLSLGLSAQRPDVRIRAAEVFAATVPQRLGASRFAAGMANCAGPCTLPRWAGSLADAATISGPAADSVVEVLTHLLPRLEHKSHGVGKLTGLLLDECIRLARAPENAALRVWLAGFSGSSAAARTARQLLAL